MRSFRMRLAVVSALLSAAIVVAFGFGSWWLIRNAKLGQLESEMKNLAAREVGQLSRTEIESGAREAEFATALGMRAATDVAVLVDLPTGQVHYQSAHWPAQVLAAVTHRLNHASVPSLDADGPSGWLGSLAFAAPGRGGGGGGGPGAGPGPAGASADLGDGLRRNGPGPSPEGIPARPFPPPDNSVKQPASPPHAPVPPPAPATFAPPDKVPGAGGGTGEVPAPPVRSREYAPSGSSALPAPPGSVQSTEVAPGRPEAVSSEPALPVGPAVVPPREPERTGSAMLPPPAPGVRSFSVEADGQSWRVVVGALPQWRLVVAANVRSIDDDLRRTRNGFLLLLPLALGLVGAVSWWVAGRALVPLETVTQAARRVTAGGLDKRIDAQGQDREFTELIDVFNRMLARLERSFGQANRFTADAAHELKTPLAIIQGQLERSLVQAHDNPGLQAALTSTLDEVQRLSSISRKLLLLAQADAGRLRVTHERVDLGAMLNDLLEDARMLAPELDLQGRVQDALWVKGDATLLRQVLHNLLSNAIKYNLPGGWIRIQTARWGQRLEVSVCNASHGIPLHERARLFERFFRADPAHGRAVEGVGLGLSVSREIARAHGGDLVFKGESGDGGVEFALLLPLP